MLKVALLLHLILATAIIGVLVIAVVSIPSLASQAMKLILVVAGVGFVVAVPVSIWPSRRILAQTRGA